VKIERWFGHPPPAGLLTAQGAANRR
jgi:hypothetical protein